MKGFLEEENCPKTYKSFLEECKLLSECQFSIKHGLAFVKTIHGKTLKEFLQSKQHHF